ncbi:hypothetical protein V1512DRAFT_257493 [Lipomyces arxii]|uniref:uncharacterized protein n=1 Tax=Lipomyces arxii TaxID=56418 RepID=UPI0034CDFE4C
MSSPGSRKVNCGEHCSETVGMHKGRLCTLTDSCDECCCCDSEPCDDVDHCASSCNGTDESCEVECCEFDECGECADEVCHSPCCVPAGSMSTSLSSSSSSGQNTPLEEYCHWGDACQFSFTSPADLDEHLKSSHISFLQHQNAQKQLAIQMQRQQQQKEMQEQEQFQRELESSPQFQCLWDACNVTVEKLDRLLSHVKQDHMAPAQETVAPTQCHWSQCSDQELDARVIDTHMLNHMTSFAQPMQCEWDQCSFSALSSSSLVSHVVQDHVPVKQEVKYQHDHIHDHAHAHDHAHDHDHDHDHGHHHLHHGHGHGHHEHAQWHVREHGHFHEEQTEHRCMWMNGGNQCGYIFTSTEDLSQHIIAEHVGSRKKVYVCEWAGCERRREPFSQRQKLIRHLQIHTNHKQFKCSVCGRRFGEQAVLTQHMRVHSGERPYGCKVCGKTFAVSTALSVHMRTHTGEKPLKCKWPGCEKAFSESSNLAKHMRIHKADMRFKCEYCRRKFLRHDQLMRHMKTHISDEHRAMVDVCI